MRGFGTWVLTAEFVFLAGCMVEIATPTIPAAYRMGPQEERDYPQPVVG